jgi:proteasome lid subunit RPN8/RPN11
VVEFKQITSIDLTEQMEKYLIDLLKLSPDLEVCGVLGGRVLDGRIGRVSYAEPITNISEFPGGAYTMDPLELNAALDKITDWGLDIIGTFHTHPGGIAAVPSAIDIEECSLKIPMLIVGKTILFPKGHVLAWNCKNPDIAPEELPIIISENIGVDAAPKPKPIAPVDPLDAAFKALEKNKVGLRVEFTPEGIRELGDLIKKVMLAMRGQNDGAMERIGHIVNSGLGSAFGSGSASTTSLSGTMSPVESSDDIFIGYEKLNPMKNPEPHRHRFKAVSKTPEGKILMECEDEHCNETQEIDGDIVDIALASGLVEQSKDDSTIVIKPEEVKNDGKEDTGNPAGKDTIEKA